MLCVASWTIALFWTVRWAITRSTKSAPAVVGRRGVVACRWAPRHKDGCHNGDVAP